MTYKLSEFQSIDPGHVVKLREAGIETTDDMMRAWADQPKRASVAEKAGMDMDHFTNLASMSRLARVKNVGPKFVGVLLAAGIDGPKSLFEHTPEALVKRLGEVATEKKLSSPVPTLEEVGPWYGDPKSEAVVAK
ncbi:MAG TPA: DUF4332 domain-containing protein [Candidatus Eisenbacteria bacterium]|nr:DUF4332 domain-containing protein [Candidatus Eisenbacteria bacterium]